MLTVTLIAMSTPTYTSNEPSLTIMKCDLLRAIQAVTPSSKHNEVISTVEVVFTVMKNEGAESAVSLLAYGLMDLGNYDDGLPDSLDG
ncbi:hypothetical protein GCM10011273_35640 [Asticcacaulis endophyticus]|uniref:Uncharacterized protein n=1 Tax=Asticcacaulis endophyticus TaxID=1395890 RepID=A0A918UZS4_9CAUL|nr:hypothetical protein GCM10011273_35640 [Asticcacaulis endophyticus]